MNKELTAISKKTYDAKRSGVLVFLTLLKVIATTNLALREKEKPEFVQNLHT